ncbi:MAG: hypothetical protein KAI62_07270 [Actinomycetia bacterium]|nr:hypothetical protein [Actinomycetes bacterium]
MIVVFGALKIELDNIIRKTNVLYTMKKDGVRIQRGNLNGKDIIIVITGMGRENAIKATRLVLKMISQSGTSNRILITGFCGAADPGLMIGDLVVYREIMDLGSIKDYLAGTGQESFNRYTITGFGPSKYMDGFRTVVCGCVEEAVTDPKIKEKIYKNFSTDVMDMESYWIAGELLTGGFSIKDICCIRAVSDNAKDYLPIYFASKSKSKMILYFTRSVFLSIFSRKELRANINALRNIKNAKKQIDIRLLKNIS